MCTSNFLYEDAAGTFFLGSAAHCYAGGDAFLPADCQDMAAQGPAPVGTRVTIRGRDGQDYTAELAYSSWGTMIAVGESDDAACSSNDFAMVRITDAAAATQIHPAVILLEGPTGAPRGGTTLLAGEDVVGTGNSDTYAGGLFEQCPRRIAEEFIETRDSGWRLDTQGALAGSIQGDSGMGLMDMAGRPVGVLSGGSVNPLNSIAIWTNLALALDYMAVHGALVVEVVTWGNFAPGGNGEDACEA